MLTRAGLPPLPPGPTRRTVGGRLWRRWAWTAWVVFAAAVGVKSAIEPHRHSLYPCFSLSAHNWWAEANLYSPDTGYRYSPAFAIAFSAFTWLPDRLGDLVWNLVSIGVTAWSLRVATRRLLPADWQPAEQALFVVLSLAGCARGLWAGQSNGLVIGFALLAAAALVDRRWWAAAFYLAGAVFIKVWPLALVLLLLPRYSRHLAWRFAAACGVLAAAPFLAKPYGVVIWQYSQWYALLTGPCQTRLDNYRDLWNIWGAFQAPSTDLPLRFLPLVVAAGALAWCLWQWRRLHAEAHWLLAVVAAWSVWQLLLGPGSERNTYGIMAPSAAWAIITAWRDRRWVAVAASGCLISILFGGSGALERALQPYLPLAQGLLPLGAVCLGLWLGLYHRGQFGRSTCSQRLTPARPLSQRTCNAAGENVATPPLTADARLR